ncbi:hypothetical protein UPYG_G00038300 [Umbra pygmaea]|uniref:SH3 domain-containing protein n=1 Tax=Umbra pygmaea TaxID=75934 RepID=A0ABD0YBC9_UMBPY
MGESVDVRALRARFHAQADMPACRDSTSPVSPLPGFGATANGLLQHKRIPIQPTPPVPGSSSTPDNQMLLPRPVKVERESKPTSPKLPPPTHSYGSTKEQPRPVPQPSEIDRQSKVKVTGELLQNMMLKHKGVPSTPTKSSSPYLPSQRSLKEVTPLRRPLPPEGPRPIKPRRPPHINLQAHQRIPRVPAFTERPELRKTEGGSSNSLPGLFSPSVPARPPKKPSSLPRQHTAVHVEEDYDDIDVKALPRPPGSWDKSDSLNDNSSSQIDEGSDESEIYDMIDENIEPEVKIKSSDKKKKKELRQRQEQEKREKKEQLERENKYRKRFKLGPGEIEVLHMARVRYDWQGGKNDLSVRQGDNVEIIRVKNNPGGRWLARTLTGTYGYIINTCVEVDYEEVKRKLKLCKVPEPSLPPPPPSPPQEDSDIYYDVESSDNINSSLTQEDDDYDDVQDFPPPPPEISIDPEMRKKLEKDEQEFRKKFKFEGPIKVLHIMMADATIKKPGGKDLAVDQGEILEVIQLTDAKKALCRNKLEKYGYVPRKVLLPAEGDDIYDDIDHNDSYDHKNIYDDTIQ